MVERSAVVIPAKARIQLFFVLGPRFRRDDDGEVTGHVQFTFLQAESRSSSVCYIRGMIRLVLMLPLALAACTAKPDVPPPSAMAAPPAAEQVRATPAPDLGGRWAMTKVNARPVSGLWLELGGEGLATITTKEGGIYVRTPQPPTRAYLGCNWWDPSGWTRNGDQLILGREMSRRTERGCDEGTAALDEEAYGILTRPMTMVLSEADGMRLSNEKGTLELVRIAAEAG